MTKAQLSPHLSRPCQLSTREGEKKTHTTRRSVSGELLGFDLGSFLKRAIAVNLL